MMTIAKYCDLDRQSLWRRARTIPDLVVSLLFEWRVDGISIGRWRNHCNTYLTLPSPPRLSSPSPPSVAQLTQNSPKGDRLLGVGPSAAAEAAAVNFLSISHLTFCGMSTKIKGWNDC